MKGNRRGSPPAASIAAASVAIPAPSASPPAAAKQKYTNKDGSKFITVPKPATIESHPLPLSRESSPVQDIHAQGATLDGPGFDSPAPTVNRKKAKRRAKIAAAREKIGADGPVKIQSNDTTNTVPTAGKGRQWSSPTRLNDDIEASGDEADENLSNQINAEADKNSVSANLGKSKKAKKKKKKKDNDISAVGANNGETASTAITSHSGRLRSMSSKEKIWNTNSQEERRRIKDFWLDLSEEERKSLVKVEKDTVLRKMKEQQKMTCSCHFCGRKRTAIEEELEGLYDSYYEELEQYANDPTGRQNPPLMSSNRHFTASHISHSHIPSSTYTGQEPSRGQIVGHVGEDDEEHGEYDDDLDDESEGEDEGEQRQDGDSPEPFPFGNSLKVHGGILTVADDLLKNDGQKFITMMEQLAESRMAREEDARDRYSSRSGSFVQNGNDGIHNHSHHTVSDEDNYSPEEDGDEEYDSPDEDYEDEEEVMTEAQRMEEGRRMFQIFAARMFEQRVLTAYREKVAKERQQKLLEELANEESQESLRKAKKAKEAQKRKDKAAQKKQALAEEKARKDAEKAAEEAERQVEEALKAEEHRQKAEEKRKKREAQKRLEEEERLKKEAERQRRICEQKERQAEQERKTRDTKERERKRREEVRQKEQEAQDRKERESRQRKDRDERGRGDKEAKAGGPAAKTRQKPDERMVYKTVPLPAVPALPLVPAIPISTGPAQASPTAPSQTSISLPKRPFLSHQNHSHQSQSQSQQPLGFTTAPALPQQPALPVGHASPSIPVAAPAIPKVPTPIRARQPSQQGGSVGGSQSGTASRTASLSGSGQSQNASPNPMTPVQANISSFGLAKANTGASSLGQGAASLSQNLSQAASPLSAPTQQNSPFSMAPSPISMHYPLGITPVSLPPGLGLSSQFGPLSGGNFRNSGPPSVMQMPPGMNGLGRGFGPMVPPPPGFGHHLSQDQLGTPAAIGNLLGTESNGVHVGHTRQPSAGYDTASSPAPTTQPIGRPAPIGRPGSVVHGQHADYGFPAGAFTANSDNDNPHHLGSKALLDDSDFALDSFSSRRPIAPARPAFGPASGPFGVDLVSPFGSQASLWASVPPHTVSNSFAGGPPPGFPGGGMAPGGWGMPVNSIPFSSHGTLGRSSQARSVTLRQILCRTCKELSESNDGEGYQAITNNVVNDGLIPIEAVKGCVNTLAHNYLGPVQDSELDILYDTEGNSNNGGGNFEVHRDHTNSVTAIRWIPDSLIPHLGSPAAAAPAVGCSDGNTAPIGVAPSR
ncbi:stress response protein [Grosmannia clavigera kw1407]|uniref:Stress response protein NST1 n=1 Tax=Grosmannia clavigera (strain kw1407 / UAMH 11150) TaxID=655863 RepID=F0XL43_GROCL|nr:stress response protein [Grosmannia clavigera kw1407]EFX01631.1 stress response protein [Grosmannia clavigera kw1407]